VLSACCAKILPLGLARGWKPVLRKRTCTNTNKELKRNVDSRKSRFALAAGTLLVVALASCSADNSAGYIEIKSPPPFSVFPLYLDSIRLEPLRNGSALLRHKVGISKLQTDNGGGYLGVLCTIEVKKDRITSVTVSTVTRQPRCQCGRSNGADAAGNRLCIG